MAHCHIETLQSRGFSLHECEYISGSTVFVTGINIPPMEAFSVSDASFVGGKTTSRHPGYRGLLPKGNGVM
ncbi:MAG: hypothetical protein NTU44_11490 [Bacteroidetes bacterium]|nr:hypothetical protein [Bacteroidota bacterium]